MVDVNISPLFWIFNAVNTSCAIALHCSQASILIVITTFVKYLSCTSRKCRWFCTFFFYSLIVNKKLDVGLPSVIDNFFGAKSSL